MLHADLLNNFETYYASALEELDRNLVSTPESVALLKTNLKTVHDELIANGQSIHEGTDAEWRAPIVVTQGLLEFAMAKTLLAKKCEEFKIEGFVVTPAMPTPLRLDGGKKLAEVDVSKATDFALYRCPILKEFLYADGILNAIYSHDARTALSNDQSGLAIYAANLERYKSLKDHPVVAIDMKQFPAEFTGAMYKVNGVPIAVESKQVTQIDTQNKQWSIKFGQNAEERVSAVNAFLSGHTNGSGLAL